MEKLKNALLLIFIVTLLLRLSACSSPDSTQTNTANDHLTTAPMPETTELSGEDLIKEGERIVAFMDCNICHSPKKLGERGPEPIADLLLSGHPANEQLPPFATTAPKDGWVMTNPGFTAWIGPWGVSFAANITPDSATGIGRWQEEHFFRSIKEGKYHGLENSRTLLPPMPWDAIRHMNDQELRAIFAYLKSIKPVKNAVPAPLPPKGA